MTPNDRLVLTSERLEIFPLTLEEFYLYLVDRDEFAAQFHFCRPLDWHELRTELAIANLHRRALNASLSEQYWQTLWIIQSRLASPAGEARRARRSELSRPDAPCDARLPGDARLMLGHLCFHAPPKRRAVEIAYTTETACRNRGVMTDALRLLLQWLAARPDVDSVLAETARDNLASARVLQKNGFRPRARQPVRGYAQWRLGLDELREVQ